MMQVSADLMTKRHQLFFSKSDLKGKRVLDLGCCVAATGAWVLDHGAVHYTGVELQPDFAANSRKNLAQYYSNDSWTVVDSDIESYLANCIEQFDIIVICGSIYAIFDYYSVVKGMCNVGQEVILESYHPYMGLKELWPEKSQSELMELWETFSIISVGISAQTLDKGNSQPHDSTRASMAAFKKVFGHLGWSTDFSINREAVEVLPEVYSLDTTAYAIRFILRSFKDAKSTFDFVDCYTAKESPHAIKLW
jgi:SAM-dependent methyltransferase